MPPPYRRALTRALALTLAVASATLLGPVAPAVADDIPRAPGHRLVADSRQHVLRIAHRQKADGRWEFVVEDDWDLTGQVPHDCVSWTNLFPSGTCDPVTSVMPDWQGRI